jgi:hypothetical protein
MEKMREALEKKRKADEAQHEMRGSFMAREIQRRRCSIASRGW